MIVMKNIKISMTPKEMVSAIIAILVIITVAVCVYGDSSRQDVKPSMFMGTYGEIKVRIMDCKYINLKIIDIDYDEGIAIGDMISYPDEMVAYVYLSQDDIQKLSVGDTIRVKGDLDYESEESPYTGNIVPTIYAGGNGNPVKITKHE